MNNHPMEGEDNSKKIILDLCGGTGSWSKSYKDAGYDVRNITLPQFDVTEVFMRGDRYLIFPMAKEYGDTMLVDRKKVYGILAAPPCTMFSFARTKAKKPRNLHEGMECVRACLDIIWSSMETIGPTKNKRPFTLKFWALENPYFGLLKNFLGKPAFIFDPWEFGDGYQKRTALWGNFNEPIKNPVEMTTGAKIKAKTNSYIHTLGVKFDRLESKDIHPEAFGELDRQARRSITPAGFAKAFFEANQ